MDAFWLFCGVFLRGVIISYDVVFVTLMFWRLGFGSIVACRDFVLPGGLASLYGSLNAGVC